MRKKLCFLMSILFLAGICVTAKAAGTPIDDRQFNFSWEWDPNGEPILCHTGEMADSLAWNDNGKDWSGVDVNCGHEGPDCDNCKEGYRYPDGNVVCFVNGGSATFQLLDPNIDANVIIVPGKKYTMLLDLYTYNDWYFDISLYHSTEPNWIPEPDVNDLVKERFLLGEIIYEPTGRGDWFFDCKVSFVALPGADYIGERLGIHLYNPYTGGTWLFADNVRLEWEWATSAFNPSPTDGELYVDQNKDLSWMPGLWAANTSGHILYFGTDRADVNDRSRTGGASDYSGDANSFDPGTLELGQTYYWTVTEVNDSDIPVGIPNPPWLGEIWSFTVEGRASNPSPENGAEDESIYAVLSWTPGTASESHDVYFGTDFDEVDEADDSDPNVFMGNQGLNSYDPGMLDLGQTYYWRIDEVRNGRDDIIKGYMWSFTVAEYLMIDDMESYESSTTIDDTWVEAGRADITLQTADGDANYVRGEAGQSMKFYFTNNFSPYYAKTTRTFSSAQNWTVAGFKVLTLYFRASVGNLPSAVQPMYVFVSDGVDTGTIEYDDPGDLARGWAGWQTWNIELQDFADASVDLSNVTKIGITIGAGGSAAGVGYVYFDDIRLYPTRCVVEEATGSFTNDCDVDIYDLAVLASDWLVSEIGNVTATTAPSDEDLFGHWTMDDYQSGTSPTATVVLDVSGNENHGTLYDSDGGKENTKAHSVIGINGKALTFDGLNDYVELPALNSSSNTITITAWIKRAIQGHIYDGIVMSSTGGEGEEGYTAGLQLGSAPDWSPNYELSFMWTGYSWEWHTELLVSPEKWTFTALTVAPDVATIYLSDGVTLQAARNYDSYEPKPWDLPFHVADQMQYEERFFPGVVDDVRIYNRTLSHEEILYLALWGPGSQYLPLEPWRANADGDGNVDLADYAIMADSWLTEVLWP